MNKTEMEKIDAMNAAVQEAYRFIERAEVAIGKIVTHQEDIFHSPAIAAAKRASMDLSKALVEIRQGGR